MSQSVDEQEIKKTLDRLTKDLNRLYGQDMGFFLVCSPFNQDSSIADYFGNSRRESAILWMEETLKRFKNREDGKMISGEHH